MGSEVSGGSGKTQQQVLNSTGTLGSTGDKLLHQQNQDLGAGGGGAAGAAGSVTAAAAAAEEEDSSWEQVPADHGEFDIWQPARQQQQGGPWWRLLKQQQQQQGVSGSAEQSELGPEAWNALGHIRQVREQEMQAVAAAP